MTTEREQLTLAAKACGIELPEHWSMHDPYARTYWNPKRSDGDCARMEAQLGLWVTWGESGVTAACVKSLANHAEYFKDHAGDKNAARRAASVAVASEIGRMK